MLLSRPCPHGESPSMGGVRVEDPRRPLRAGCTRYRIARSASHRAPRSQSCPLRSLRLRAHPREPRPLQRCGGRWRRRRQHPPKYLWVPVPVGAWPIRLRQRCLRLAPESARPSLLQHLLPPVALTIRSHRWCPRRPTGSALPNLLQPLLFPSALSTRSRRRWAPRLVRVQDLSPIPVHRLRFSSAAQMVD